MMRISEVSLAMVHKTADGSSRQMVRVTSGGQVVCSADEMAVELVDEFADGVKECAKFMGYFNDRGEGTQPAQPFYPPHLEGAHTWPDYGERVSMGVVRAYQREAEAKLKGLEELVKSLRDRARENRDTGNVVAAEAFLEAASKLEEALR